MAKKGVSGISEKKLIEKRDRLRADIVEMEREEVENSTLIHQATAAKIAFRASIVEAKSRLVLLEQHIEDCEDLGEAESVPIS